MPSTGNSTRRTLLAALGGGVFSGAVGGRTTTARAASDDEIDISFEGCRRAHFRGSVGEDYRAEAVVVTHGTPHDIAGDQPDRKPQRLAMTVGVPATFPQTIDATEWIAEMIVDPPAESALSSARVTRGPRREVLTESENPTVDCLEPPESRCERDN